MATSSTAGLDLSSYSWARAEHLEAKIKSVTPGVGSFFVQMDEGLGICYGGERTNVGGKGVIANMKPQQHDTFYKTSRKEKKSDDLPYHNVDLSAGVLLDSHTILMWGGRDRYTANYTDEGYIINTSMKTNTRGIEDYIIKQTFPFHDKIRGRVGHTLTLLNDGRVMLFGGKQRPDWATSRTSDLYRDSTPHGLFTLGREDFHWTEAIVEGDVPEGRAFHTVIQEGGKYYIIGGISMECGELIGHADSYILTYNSISKSFHSTRFPSSIQISHHTCNILHNTLILSGGFNSDDTMNAKTYLIDIHDFTTDTLQTGYENTGHHSLVVHSKIYAFGGDKKKKIWIFVNQRNDDDEYEMDTAASVNEPSNEDDVLDEFVGIEESGNEDEVDERSGLGELSNEDESGVDSDKEEVADRFVCYMQRQCKNDRADQNVRDILLTCMKCSEIFHLFCIGFVSNPFMNDEQRENSMYYCRSCRENFKDELQTQMTRRQWRNLEKNSGIIKDHHFY